ncbi:MAG: LacI family DNA-binding transcriptional regulator, partial [Acidobacteriota bacterium]
MPRNTRRKTAAKPPDIRAVAALAKVSIATVSRTINGSNLVSEKLKKRVSRAVQQLNYFPNAQARTLVSGRSRLFGIIVENI